MPNVLLIESEFMSIKKLIREYLNGPLTKAQYQNLQDYFKAKDLSVLKEVMKQDWDAAAGDSKIPADLSEEMLRQIKAETRTAKMVKMKRSNPYRWLAVASVALILISVGATMWFNVPSKITVVTAYGEWKSIRLPDNSLVNLNANSELTYISDWAEGSNRKVWLQGEAFFKVKKDKAKTKFSVITDDLAVEVLGTAFNVNSRGEETKVYLEEGKIKLKLAETETYMKPGEFVAYSSEKKVITERVKASTEPHASWKDGTMILKDETVANIIRKVEEIFGVKLNPKNKEILSQKKTIKIPMDEIEVAIPMLERVLEVTVVKKELKTSKQ